MLSTKRKPDVVVFPLNIFETADTKEDLEDWLLVQDREFIKKTKKARKDDIEGKGKDWKLLKEEMWASCKSTKSRHSHESGSPELNDLTGCCFAREDTRFHGNDKRLIATVLFF
jgi:hypothetical protein